jgi:hypothetical protein
MPGPGTRNKHKKIKQSKPSALRPPEPFVGDIDNAEHWYLIAEILCNVLNIPGTRAFIAYLTRNNADLKNFYRPYYTQWIKESSC